MKVLDHFYADMVGGGDPGLVVIVPPGSGGPNIPPGPLWDPATGTWRPVNGEARIDP